MQDQLQRRQDDKRAPGAVDWSDAGTPLADSSVVYLYQPREGGFAMWSEIKTEERLAEVQAAQDHFELRTLFTVPVDDLARAPVSVVAHARGRLDDLERRAAQAGRRAADGVPAQLMQDAATLLETASFMYDSTAQSALSLAARLREANASPAATPAAGQAGLATDDQSDIDRFWNKAIEAEAEASHLRQENDALRAALKKITETPSQCIAIADAALSTEK